MHAGGSGGSGTARRLHMLDRSLYERAVFVPPGYTSLLYAHGYEDNSCPYNTALFKVIFIICMDEWICHFLICSIVMQKYAVCVDQTFMCERWYHCSGQ